MCFYVRNKTLLWARGIMSESNSSSVFKGTWTLVNSSCFDLGNCRSFIGKLCFIRHDEYILCVLLALLCVREIRCDLSVWNIEQKHEQVCLQCRNAPAAMLLSGLLWPLLVPPHLLISSSPHVLSPPFSCPGNRSQCAVLTDVKFP